MCAHHTKCMIVRHSNHFYADSHAKLTVTISPKQMTERRHIKALTPKLILSSNEVLSVIVSVSSNISKMRRIPPSTRPIAPTASANAQMEATRLKMQTFDFDVKGSVTLPLLATTPRRIIPESCTEMTKQERSW